MTKQIKIYAYHKNSESKDGSFDCFETDVELEGHTHLILKTDHDDFCKQAQEKTDEDIKLMSDRIIGLEKNQKNIIEALKKMQSFRHYAGTPDEKYWKLCFNMMNHELNKILEKITGE